MTEETATRMMSGKERQSEISEFEWFELEKTEPYLCSISEISNFASRG
jgi:hypothetical protein